MTELKTKIRNLNALKSACEAIGLEFVEGQTTFKWYGHHVGDYPIPKGFGVSDMGKCEHALRVKGNTRAYEIGVARSPDGDGWTLLYDFWAKGQGLMDVVGENCDRLVEEYTVATIEEQAIAEGWVVSRAVHEGHTRLFLES